MIMTERRYAAIFLVILAVGSVSGLALLFGRPLGTQIPPPDSPPDNDDDIISTGDIVVPFLVILLMPASHSDEKSGLTAIL